MLKQQASCSNSGTDRVDLFAVAGEDGLTPLHDAIQNKHFSIVSMYLDAITANDRRTGDDGLIRMVKMKTGEEGKTVWGYTRDSADMTALIQVWQQPFSFFYDQCSSSSVGLQTFMPCLHIRPWPLIKAFTGLDRD